MTLFSKIFDKIRLQLPVLLGNRTPTPPKNLRLLTTLQPCKKAKFVKFGVKKANLAILQGCRRACKRRKCQCDVTNSYCKLFCNFYPRHRLFPLCDFIVSYSNDRL